MIFKGVAVQPRMFRFLPTRVAGRERRAAGGGDDSGIMNPFGVFAKISLFTGVLTTERVANDWWIVYVVILLEEAAAAGQSHAREYGRVSERVCFVRGR